MHARLLQICIEVNHSLSRPAKAMLPILLTAQCCSRRSKAVYSCAWTSNRACERAMYMCPSMLLDVGLLGWLLLGECSHLSPACMCHWSVDALSLLL